MSPLEREILKECASIAESVLYNYDIPEAIGNPSEIWSSDDRDALTQKFFQIALRQLEYIGTEHDPRILLRAIRYLSAHAIPPMRDRTDWFSEGLHVLVVLACPYFGTPPEGKPFFEDIREGMRQAEEWTEESSE